MELNEKFQRIVHQINAENEHISPMNRAHVSIKQGVIELINEHGFDAVIHMLHDHTVARIVSEVSNTLSSETSLLRELIQLNLSKQSD